MQMYLIMPFIWIRVPLCFLSFITSGGEMITGIEPDIKLCESEYETNGTSFDNFAQFLRSC